MKILLVPAQYPANAADHSGIFVRDQAQALAQKHEVTVLAPRLVTLRSRFAHSNQSSVATPDSGENAVREIPVIVANFSNRWERLTHWLWQRQVHRRGCELFATNPPDIVHAHFARPAGVPALRLAKAWRVPVVLTEHSGPFSVHTSTSWRRRHTSTVLHQVDRVIAVSPGLRAEIQTAFPDVKIRVLGNVVHEGFFHLPAQPPARGISDPFRFLFVGNLVSEKGLSILIDAAAHLWREPKRKWTLTIAGAGPLRQELEQRVRQCGLEAHVLFGGQFSRSAVRDALHDADAAVLPSITETFGVFLLEAMACGVPVVSTDCQGPSWTVQPDCGLLVPRANASALAEALKEMIDRRNEFDGLKIRNHAVGRFGRKSWLEGCEGIYREAGARG